MPRKRRACSSTNVYHVGVRAVNQQMIFEEEYDYVRYLQILELVREKYDVTLYAYCLMENHVHLLIQVKEFKDLSKFMHNLNTRFAYWYNKKYERHGHLSQDRYFSVPIEDAAKFLIVLRYIHNNPVKAAMVTKARGYKWSSTKAYYSEKIAEEQNITVGVAAYYAGSMKELHKFLVTPADDECEDFPEYKHTFSGEQVREMLLECSGCKNLEQFRKLDRDSRNYCFREVYGKGVSVRALSRVSGCARRTITNALNGE